MPSQFGQLYIAYVHRGEIVYRVRRRYGIPRGGILSSRPSVFRFAGQLEVHGEIEPLVPRLAVFGPRFSRYFHAVHRLEDKNFLKGEFAWRAATP